MEVETGRRKLLGPSPFPHLIYVGGEDGEKMAFFSINQIGDQKDIIETTPPELRGKIIMRSCYGWLILLDLDEEEEYNQYSLWNPFTSESICLPALHLEPEQDLGECVLTSPPGNDDSILLFFEKNAPSFIYCRIGDIHWTHQPITEAFRYSVHDYLAYFGVCNGTLYCRTFNTKRLVRIDMSMPDQHLALEFLDVYAPTPQENVGHYFVYMLELESSGELYVIYLGKGGPHQKQALTLEVFRMDSSCMEWNKVESFNDLALFLDDDSSFFWPAIGSGIKGNHVYFTSPEDRSLYSFNMADKTVSVSLPCPNLSISSFIPTWVMPPDLRDANIESKNYIDDGRKIKSENGDVVKYCEPVTKEEAAGDHFSKLYLDIVYAFGRCLILGDYMSFRAVNKLFRMAAPPIQWKVAALKGFEAYDKLTPWLTSLKKGDAICNLIDPFRGEKYYINIPNNQSKDTKMCYSRDGWCVMLQGERSIFLWNPLVEETILLPDLLPDFLVGQKYVSGCSFSSSKDWVVLIRNDYQIDFIFLKEDEWHSFQTDNDLRPLMIWVTNPIFYDGGFYFFCTKGKLAVIKCHEEDSFFEILDQLITPCPSDETRESFLLECDGMLLSVLVGFLGEWVRVFKLDLSEMAWVEIENLGKNTIFVSRYSCFSMTASSPGMENRVYFPRFYNKDENVVYYSLITRKLHSHGTEEVLENFYNTKEQLSSTWIEPKWF